MHKHLLPFWMLGLVFTPVVWAQSGGSRSADQEADHLVQPLAAGFRMENPENRLAADFSPGGMTALNPGGRLGLRLMGYGDGELHSQGTRVEYRRAALTEWYVNDARGIEQGFTIYRPLAGPIELEVAGDLQPALADNQVMFERNRHPVLRYSGLRAWDANFRTLPAHLEVRGRRLRILVDDAGASYPVTIDPWIQQQELIAADGAPGSWFGRSVAIDGTTAIVGATGGGLFSANTFVGSAYVYVSNGGTWTLQQELKPADGVAGDFFGYSVAVNRDTAVIGTHKNTVGGSGKQGSAYVFVRNGTSWTQQQELKASDGAAEDNFGTSVGISGDTAIVGKPNQTCCQGAVYLFTRSGTSWTQQQEILAPDGYPGDDDQFGAEVAIDQNTFLACADSRSLGTGYVYFFDGTSWNLQQEVPSCRAVAVRGDTAIFGIGTNTLDAANVYTRTGTVWTLQQQLTAADGTSGENFGVSVALDGDTALIGDSTHPVGSNFSQGAAYLFTRSGGVWTQDQEFTASDAVNGSNFGFAVALGGAQAIVGAYDKKVGSNSYQGVAYAFQGPLPVLSVIPTHTGTWTRGSTATIDVTVGNSGNAATNGAITLTNPLPGGMTLNAGSATNDWNCTGTTTVTCTTSDSINPAASSPFTFIVSLDNTVADLVTNTVSVSGGGDSNPHIGSDGPSPVAGTNLSIVLAHPYQLFQGENGGIFIVTVTNTGANGLGAGPGATVGTVSVAETLPGGFTLASLSGPGWNCSLSTANCMSNGSLATGASSMIIVTVNVPGDAQSQVTNQVSVSGGGAPPAAAGDTANIVALSPCDANLDASTNVQDVQLVINQALGDGSPIRDLNQDGAVNVVDAQIAINAALGGVCTAANFRA